MILGKDLKRLVAVIPDNAVVYIARTLECSIEGITVETGDPFPEYSLNITEGYSITKDSVIDEMFKDLERQYKQQ